LRRLQLGWILYEGVSKSFRTESTTKYTLTTINTRWEATQRVMVAKLTRLTHKIAIQLFLVAESCTISSSRSRWPVREPLDTPSYIASCVANTQEPGELTATGRIIGGASPGRGWEFLSSPPCPDRDVSGVLYYAYIRQCRSQWPRGLRNILSSAARIPLAAWMYLRFFCVVL
jgi:hypothetical protein